MFFFLAGLVAAIFALVFARGRRVSIAAACLIAGFVAALPASNYSAPGNQPIVVLIFAAATYAIVRIAARLTGALSRLGARTAP